MVVMGLYVFTATHFLMFAIHVEATIVENKNYNEVVKMTFFCRGNPSKLFGPLSPIANSLLLSTHIIASILAFKMAVNLLILFCVLIEQQHKEYPLTPKIPQEIGCAL